MAELGARLLIVLAVAFLVAAVAAGGAWLLGIPYPLSLILIAAGWGFGIAWIVTGKDRKRRHDAASTTATAPPGDVRIDKKPL
jgi:phosphate/sulfate permease